MTETNKETDIIRFTVIMQPTYKDKIEVLAKTYAITQGEVLEVLLDRADMNVLDSHFTAKRESKLSKRSKASATRKILMQKVKDLSPEQIEQLLKDVK